MMKPKKKSEGTPRPTREPLTSRRFTPTDGITLVMVRVRGIDLCRPLARALLRVPLLPGAPPTLLAWSRVGGKESGEHAAWLVAGTAPYRRVTLVLAAAGLGFREEAYATQVRLTRGAVLTDPAESGRREDVEARGMPLWTVTLGETRTLLSLPSQVSIFGSEERPEPTVCVTLARAEPGRMAGLIPHAQPELGAWVLGCDGAPALLTDEIAPRYEVQWQSPATRGAWKKTPAETLLAARTDFACTVDGETCEGFKARLVETNTGAIYVEASLSRDRAGCLVRRVAHHSVEGSERKRARVMDVGDAVITGNGRGTVEKIDGDTVTLEIEDADTLSVPKAALKWKRLTGLAKGDMRSSWFVSAKALKAARAVR